MTELKEPDFFRLPIPSFGKIPSFRHLRPPPYTPRAFAIAAAISAAWKA